jgi:hypothetical protein
MKHKFYGQIFEKYSSIKFNENPFSVSQVVPCGQADKRRDAQKNMTKLTFATKVFAAIVRFCNRFPEAVHNCEVKSLLTYFNS